MAAERRRPGRPIKPARPGERASLGLRVSGELKQRIDEAAKKAGRTQGQEAEARLERTFREEALLDQVLELAYGRWLSGVLMLIGDAMKDTGPELVMRQLDPTKPIAEKLDQLENWHVDPWAFDQARRAALIVLDAFRPPGDRAPKGKRLRAPGKPYLEAILFARHYAPGMMNAQGLIKGMLDPSIIGGERGERLQRVRDKLKPDPQQIDRNMKRSEDQEMEGLEAQERRGGHAR